MNGFIERGSFFLSGICIWYASWWLCLADGLSKSLTCPLPKLVQIIAKGRENQIFQSNSFWLGLLVASEETRSPKDLPIPLRGDKALMMAFRASGSFVSNRKGFCFLAWEGCSTLRRWNLLKEVRHLRWALRLILPAPFPVYSLLPDYRYNVTSSFLFLQPGFSCYMGTIFLNM